MRFLAWGPIDLTVGAGECVGVSGASGSGKTLLLRAIADLDPHRGRISLDGTASVDIEAPRWRQRVGLLPAESRWWYDTVGEHFTAHPGELLGRLQLPGDRVLAWEVSRLSAGERQRLALARLLVRRPEALLLDEPTANLNAEAGAAVEAVVAGLGLPVIWVSHDVAQLQRVAARRFRMDGGRLQQEA